MEPTREQITERRLEHLERAVSIMLDAMRQMGRIQDTAGVSAGNIARSIEKAEAELASSRKLA